MSQKLSTNFNTTFVSGNVLCKMDKFVHRRLPSSLKLNALFIFYTYSYTCIMFKAHFYTAKTTGKITVLRYMYCIILRTLSEMTNCFTLMTRLKYSMYICMHI